MNATYAIWSQKKKKLSSHLEAKLKSVWYLVETKVDF